jgi:nucleolar protein 56
VKEFQLTVQMPVPNYLLSESAAGYTLYEVTQSEEIGSRSKEFLETIADLYSFSKLVKLISFTPFKNAAHALENINDVSEGSIPSSIQANIGILNDHLKAFLELNLKSSKSKKQILGVSDPKLAGSIKDDLGKGFEFDTGDVTQDLLRGIRLHASKLVKNLQPGDLEKAQLGLGHSYSRAKVKFNVNKSDNMIIQTIALLDQLDKDINTFAMRVRYPTPFLFCRRAYG